MNRDMVSVIIGIGVLILSKVAATFIATNFGFVLPSYVGISLFSIIAAGVVGFVGVDRYRTNLWAYIAGFMIAAFAIQLFPL